MKNPDAKIVHYFGKVRGGRVSALCFPIPHRIDLKKETWALVEANVTCPKCLKILKEQR